MQGVSGLICQPIKPKSNQYPVSFKNNKSDNTTDIEKLVKGLEKNKNYENDEIDLNNTATELNWIKKDLKSLQKSNETHKSIKFIINLCLVPISGMFAYATYKVAVPVAAETLKTAAKEVKPKFINPKTIISHAKKPFEFIYKKISHKVTNYTAKLDENSKKKAIITNLGNYRKTAQNKINESKKYIKPVAEEVGAITVAATTSLEVYNNEFPSSKGA